MVIFESISSNSTRIAYNTRDNDQQDNLSIMFIASEAVTIMQDIVKSEKLVSKCARY